MNDKERLGFAGVEPVEWAQLGYDDDVAGAGNDLTSPISPIFAYENDGLRLWDIHPWQYELLKPTLRLASALLYSLGSCKFLCVVIYATCQAASADPRRRHWWVVSEQNVYGTISDWQQVMELTWRYLAGRINYASANDLPQNVRADCGLKSSFGEELRIEIRIKQDRLQHLLNLLVRYEPNDIRVLYAQLDMAISLDHEIAHAIHFAKNCYSPGRGPIEPFYENDRCVELGFAWTHQVLGGLLGPDLELSNEGAVRTLRPWATFDGTEDRNPATRADPPAAKVEWLADLHHILRLQRQEFWDKLPIEMTACRFPELIGRVEFSDRRREYLPSPPTRETYFEDAVGKYTLKEHCDLDGLIDLRIIRVQSLK